MPLFDLDGAIISAAKSLQSYLQKVLDEGRMELLRKLQTDRPTRQRLFEQLQPDAPVHRTEFWQDRAVGKDEIATCAKMFGAGFLTTLDRRKLAERQIDDPDVRAHRYRYVTVYLADDLARQNLQLHLLQARQIKNPVEFKDVWQDPTNKLKLEERFEHAITHELMHVLTHYDWIHSPVRTTLISKDAAQFIFEGTTEYLNRRARDVDIGGVRKGYGYWDECYLIKEVWKQPFQFQGSDGPQEQFGHLIKLGFFRGSDQSPFKDHTRGWHDFLFGLAEKLDNVFQAIRV